MSDTKDNIRKYATEVDKLSKMITDLKKQNEIVKRARKALEESVSKDIESMEAIVPSPLENNESDKAKKVEPISIVEKTFTRAEMYEFAKYARSHSSEGQEVPHIYEWMRDKLGVKTHPLVDMVNNFRAKQKNEGDNTKPSQS